MRFCLAVLALALGLSAQGLSLKALVFTVNGRYNSMRTWEADFTQIYTSGLARRTESGHLYLAKPGRMRWDYHHPAKLFLVNGNRIWQYNAGDAAATVTSVHSADDLRTPLRFLLGHTDLGRELANLSFSALRPWHPGDYVIVGQPRPGEAGTWNRVWIEITTAYEIDRLVISTLDGARNDIRLSHIRPNVRLPPKWFDFQPPPGVRVIPG